MCELPGCDGQPLSRFWQPDTSADAMIDNRHAVEAVVGEVLSADSRFVKFQDMCAAAEQAATGSRRT